MLGHKTTPAPPPFLCIHTFILQFHMPLAQRATFCTHTPKTPRIFPRATAPAAEATFPRLHPGPLSAV